MYCLELHYFTEVPFSPSLRLTCVSLCVPSTQMHSSGIKHRYLHSTGHSHIFHYINCYTLFSFSGWVCSSSLCHNKYFLFLKQKESFWLFLRWSCEGPRKGWLHLRTAVAFEETVTSHRYSWHYKIKVLQIWNFQAVC